MKKIVIFLLMLGIGMTFLAGCGESSGEAGGSSSGSGKTPDSESSPASESPSDSGSPSPSESDLSESEEKTTEPAEIIFNGFCGDNVDWTLDSAGTLTISGTGAMDNYCTFADYFGETEVEPWYDYCEDIHSVVVEDGVTSIGSGAFYNMTNLTSITIADSVTSIGAGFLVYSGTLLEDFEFPPAVTEISPFAFEYCPIPNITIPETVTVIDDDAFNGSYTETITIPGSVTSIGDRAFKGSFWGSRLTDVSLSSGLTSIGANAFEDCTELKDLTIPDSVETIGDEAFAKSGLENITLGTGLTYLGQAAFSDCSDLETVTFLGNPPELGLGIFGLYGSSMTFSVCYPADNAAWTRDFMQELQGYASINWVKN